MSQASISHEVPCTGTKAIRVYLRVVMWQCGTAVEFIAAIAASLLVLRKHDCRTRNSGFVPKPTETQRQAATCQCSGLFRPNGVHPWVRCPQQCGLHTHHTAVLYTFGNNDDDDDDDDCCLVRYPTVLSCTRQPCQTDALRNKLEMEEQLLRRFYSTCTSRTLVLVHTRSERPVLGMPRSLCKLSTSLFSEMVAQSPSIFEPQSERLDRGTSYCSGTPQYVLLQSIDVCLQQKNRDYRSIDVCLQQKNRDYTCIIEPKLGQVHIFAGLAH